MQTITVGKSKIAIYTSLESLPIKRYHEFSHWFLYELGIGDLTKMPELWSKMDSYIGSKDWEKLNTARKNLQYNLFFAIQKLNPITMAFACLVDNINDHPCNDLSEDGLRETVKRLEKTNIKHEDVRDHTEQIKKKLMLNLE